MGFLSHWRKGAERFLAKITGASDSLEKKMAKVRDLYRVIDADVKRFQAVSGLVCYKPCRHCCDNPLIASTELELLPLAKAMIDAGTVDAAYLEAEKRDFSGRCIFFEPELRPGAEGHCRMYAYRPVLCRLFGHSGNLDKYGKVRLSVCAALKQADPDLVVSLAQKVLSGKIKAPVMGQYTMRALAIDPEMERETFPINMAFKRAVDRIWIHQHFIGSKE